jgi:carbon-monoxide dehydrogenase medium subunit
MSFWKNYFLAHTLTDALQALAGAAGPACPIAGGTDLLLDLQQGRHAPVDTLVDVTAVAEMTALEIRGDRLYIGAALPLNRIIASPLVKDHAQALVEAGSLIGGPQVRNTATLGGNVAHALPAADGTIALLALGAQAEVATLEGCRMVPVAELFLGPGKSTLERQRELLVGFSVPLKATGQGSAFRRVMRPQGVAIAILNLGAWVQRGVDAFGREILEDLRLAVGPGGPTPFRARTAEAALRGQSLSEETIRNACSALLAEARFRSSPHRSTADYRRHLSSVLLREVLRAAWGRAAGAVPDC